MTRNRREPRGFTMVELLVALAIAGLLALTAHGLFAAAIEQARRVAGARSGLDRRENAGRWLAQAVESLGVGKDDPGPFIGTRDALEFSTRLPAPYGWHEENRVSIRQEDDRLVGRLVSGAEIVLADSIAAVEFDYLVERGESAPWLGGWTSSVNPPLAIRVRVRRAQTRPGDSERVDTSLFVIGGRG